MSRRRSVDADPAVLAAVYDYMIDPERQRRPNYSDAVNAVVAISGAAALGKTIFCEQLETYARSQGTTIVHVQLDGFLKPRPERKIAALSGYNPHATRFRQMIPSLVRLVVDGETINFPTYDHHTGQHGEDVSISPTQVILLDGIMSLEYEIRERLLNGAIFFSAENDLLMKALRLDVDIYERGYTPIRALQHVELESKQYDRWIHYQNDFADITLIVDENRTLRFSRRAKIGA